MVTITREFFYLFIYYFGNFGQLTLSKTGAHFSVHKSSRQQTYTLLLFCTARCEALLLFYTQRSHAGGGTE